MLVIAPREIIREVMPTLAANPDALIEDMTVYAMAGLAALRQTEPKAMLKESWKGSGQR